MYHSVYDLQITKLKVLNNRIWELTVYKFELGDNDTKAKKEKKIVVLKGKSAVDHRAVTRLFKKFRSNLKDDDQALSVWSKTVDNEAVLQIIEENLVSSIQGVSCEFDISQSSVVCHLNDLNKSIRFNWFVLCVTKILLNLNILNNLQYHFF